MSEHTPTPWAIRSDDGCIHEVTDRWDLIPLISPWREGAFEAGHAAAEANMAFIIKAVNNHDHLVAALVEILANAEAGTWTLPSSFAGAARTALNGVVGGSKQP